MNPLIYKKQKDSDFPNRYTLSFPEGWTWIQEMNRTFDTPLEKFALIIDAGSTQNAKNIVKTLERYANYDDFALEPDFDDNKIAIRDALAERGDDYTQPQLILLREDLYKALDLWLTLEEENAPEIILSRKDDVITVSGNNKSFSFTYELYIPKICSVCNIDLNLNETCDCMDAEIERLKKQNN